MKMLTMNRSPIGDRCLKAGSGRLGATGALRVDSLSPAISQYLEELEAQIRVVARKPDTSAGERSA